MMLKNINSITSKLFQLNLRETVTIPNREKGEITQHMRHNRLPQRITSLPPRKIKNPVWFVRPVRSTNEAFITPGNKDFMTEVVNDRYGTPALIKGVLSYTKSVDEKQLIDIKDKLVESEFNPRRDRRCGLIARKIGVIPMWRSDGTKISATMLQVDDNHVIKYYEPNEYNPAQKPTIRSTKKFGCVLVGSGSADPSLFTKEYCGLFKESGVIPKRILGRFLVTENAKLLPGTPLGASHFRVGDFVDVRGRTVDRGFQGVMKRWGFKGMPATHGVTKTHRRPGNIGSGGQKARVWPGQKMPGQMGGRMRKNKGLQIVRINKENNVIFVHSNNVIGEINNLIYIHDTMLPLKRRIIKPPVPTSLTEIEEDNVYAEGFYNFESPTIKYEVD